MTLDTIGNISFHNHNVLDVVTNGDGSFLCVRANDNEDVNDVKYYMALARGRDGKDGKNGRDGHDGRNGRDGKDGTNADILISDNNTWVLNGVDTGKKVPVPSSATKILADGTDLNDTISNGSYYGTQTTNSPSGVSSFILHVTGADQGGMQQLTQLSDGSTWIRTWSSGTWTDWRQMTQWN